MQFDTRSLWIYLYFPKLHLDVIQRQVNAPEQLALPRVIYDPKANKMLQLNQAALEAGVKKGMGLASASLLSDNLQVHEYNVSIEEKALTQIAHQLYLVTSDIALDTPNGLFLRAQNMLNLYGGLQAYWRVLSQVLAKSGVEVQFASAYSVNVAKLLALHKLNKISDDKARLHKCLLACQLCKTDIDSKDQEKLARIGIKNIQSLFEQPLASLASRVSRFSINVISELRGEAPAKLKFYYPPEHYHDYIELLYDIELVDKLLPIIDKLLLSFEQYLLIRNALSLTIKLTLHQREHPKVEQTINSALAIYKQQDWLSIIALQFEQLKLESAVYAITLTCPKLELADIKNADFFAQKGTHVASLTLLSRLRAKLGDEKVRLLRYSQDFRPERVTQFMPVHLNDTEQQSTQQKRLLSASQSRAHALAHKNEQRVFKDRPGFILAQPETLSEKVTILNGPERIVSGWWDKEHIQRDYFVAQNNHGQQIWVYKTPEDKWFVHGYFV